jgi:two-component system chemotaxis response regulator CheV
MSQRIRGSPDMSEDLDMKRLQLEVGGSFFELIEFSVTRRIRGRSIKGIYGVNVAKVREVVRMPKINPLASRCRGVAGIFELRGVPIPAVHLSTALGDDEQECLPSQQLIVSEFSQKRAGFVVDATHRIRRIAWEKVLPPSSDAGSFITGMTLIDDNEFLFILDLERILLHLEYGNEGRMTAGMPGMPGSSVVAPKATSSAAGTGPLLLLVEDSQFIRNGVKMALERVGYRVVEAGDGAEALDILNRGLKAPPGQRIDAVVTDIEMPRMDGLSLTRRIREHAQLRQMPVLLHSSLSGKSNMQAGETVGANGYVVKNDFQTLFELLREILGSDLVSHAG